LTDVTRASRKVTSRATSALDSEPEITIQTLDSLLDRMTGQELQAVARIFEFWIAGG
jgi:hypothetical protein